MARPDIPLVHPGRVLRTLTEADAADLAKAWLRVYRPNREGINVKQYMWHVFGGRGDNYPCVSGEAALEAYAKRQAAEYLVLSNDRKQAFATDLRPERIDIADCLVFPPNFAWTMAFTHEDGWLGPYFATHPEVDRLEVENQARIRKQREAEAARAKRWSGDGG